ncbi:MAG: tetratricopeptide repeat protein [Acidiferrobacterales bacterium]
MNIEAALAHAIQHHEAGRLRDAEALYRQVLEAKPDHADALYLLGILAHEAGDQQQALALITQAIEQDGENTHYHNGLGNVLRALQRPEESLTAYRRAVELEPNAVAAQCNIGAVLQQLGELDEAVSNYERVIRLEPRYGDAHYNLGIALKDQGKLDEAIAALKRAIELDPQHAHAYVVVGGYLLEQGNARAALSAFDECLSRNPRHVHAMAFKSIALNELDQGGVARKLVDFERLIKKVRIDPPTGFSTVDEFNTALADHIRTHPTMIKQPSSGATRFGMHTDELLVETEGVFRAFKTIVNQAITDYLQRLPADSAHPYLAHRPSRWRLSTWGVVLNQQGHQIPHIHPSGWVSGVYYVKLPESFKANTKTREGWIEFGQPPPEYHGDADVETKTVQPEEGLMLLFPSYFYHRTIPLESIGERISFAFDTLPEF